MVLRAGKLFGGKLQKKSLKFTLHRYALVTTLLKDTDVDESDKETANNRFKSENTKRDVDSVGVAREKWEVSGKSAATDRLHSRAVSRAAESAPPCTVCSLTSYKMCHLNMTPRMPPASSLLRQSSAAATPSTVLWLTATVSITAASLLYVESTSKTSLEQQQSQPAHQEQFKMDVNLMDKIAEKPYLPVTKHRSVPRRLRLLAIDVPEMRTEGIDGECRVNMNKVFSDGIAPPKKIAGTDIEVVQKSFAHALVKCRHTDSLRIGVEMTEASVADLNPHNLRKTHQFGNYRYDPGKWSKTTSTANESNNSGEEQSQVEVAEEVTVDENGTTVAVTAAEETRQKQKHSSNVKKDGPDGGTVLATEDDEYDAPWNQYAWIQELQLRVSTLL